jgi:hypothetical protein
MFRISPRNSQCVHALRNSFTVSNANQTSKQSQVSNRQISVYTSQHRGFRWNKGVRYVPYYLIATHEEAGDECAHGQLIADRYRLQCRGTSLSTSSEMTRFLPRTESWVSAWLESFFRSTSELLLDVVDENGGQLARRGTE